MPGRWYGQCAFLLEAGKGRVVGVASEHDPEAAIDPATRPGGPQVVLPRPPDPR